jgi:hypothetical protein
LRGIPVANGSSEFSDPLRNIWKPLFKDKGCSKTGNSYIKQIPKQQKTIYDSWNTYKTAGRYNKLASSIFATSSTIILGTVVGYAQTRCLTGCIADTNYWNYATWF